MSQCVGIGNLFITGKLNILRESWDPLNAATFHNSGNISFEMHFLSYLESAQNYLDFAKKSNWKILWIKEIGLTLSDIMPPENPPPPPHTTPIPHKNERQIRRDGPKCIEDDI